MSNLYDKAYELEKEIRTSDEYEALIAAHGDVENDEAAKKLFDSFRDLQMDLQERQSKGEQISEEEAQKAAQQFQLIQQHPMIGKLMAAEERMSVLLNDLNKIMTQPLADLYSETSNEA